MTDGRSLNQIQSIDYLAKINIIEEESPQPSPWHFIFSSSIPIWKFDEQKIIRINLSREKFFPYYFCHILLTVFYLIYFLFLSKYYSQNDTHRQKINFYLITFFFVMTHCCFLKAHFTNPGILPFNWSETKQRNFSANELRDGIAINKSQKKWGKDHDWPARSFFSGDYGAIILRADHFCVWINHWIGLKNLKFYIQSLTYSTLFMLQYLNTLYNIFVNPDKNLFKWKKCILIVMAATVIFFLYHHIFNLSVTLYRVAINSTMVHELFYFDSRFYNKGIIKNFEEVFGPISLFPLWFFPILIPLPEDGFGYPYRPDDICLAKNRENGSYLDKKR